MAFAAVKLATSEGSILIISYLLVQIEWNSFNALFFFPFCDLFFYLDQKSAFEFYVCAHMNQLLHV